MVMLLTALLCCHATSYALSHGERARSQRLPGGQDLLNSAPHFSGTKGFHQPVYSSLLTEGHRLTGDGIACKENEPLLQLRILLQRLVEACSVQLWHAQVAQDQVIGAFLEPGQGHPTVGRGIHGMTVAAQQPGEPSDHAGFIIHHEDRLPADGLVYLLLWRRRGHGHLPNRQLDPADGALSSLARAPDGAAR